MKVYKGSHETITAERYEELGWTPEEARAMVREGATEPVVNIRDGEGVRRLEATPTAAAKSPDGFAWGYGGSGPAALAFSILADVIGQEPHPALAQDFKRKFLEPLDGDEGFEITELAVKGWLAGQQVGRP